jgi:uncharacterized protein (DUF4415 family)
MITVVFRPLGAEAISVASMRPASRKARKPGRPKLEKTVEPVMLRLDRTVVEHFRAQGADRRKRMARVLEKAASL